MANTGSTDLPNPSTPLAFLPPAVADQFELSRYLYSATLGAYIWDIAINLGNDYVLLFKHIVRFPTAVAFTLAFILVCFVNQVAPVENCDAIALGWSIGAILAKSATTMLFFLRVTAIWHTSKIAYVVFFILWLAVIAGRYHRSNWTNIEVAAIMALINNTAIFLAINYRILAHVMVTDSSTARLRVFFGGKGLSTLSRALLESGQHFYLVAVATNVTLLVVMKLPQLPPVYHAMLTVPAEALANAMACLVFRRIKLGLISSDGTAKISTIDPSSDFHATANSKSLSLTTESRSNTAFSLNVHVQREIDKFEDAVEARQEARKATNLASVLV
ncbi:hypothetical protein MSAN_02308500 [Mycena sanguinolenta]|uniref:Uncharacterized protein n=1 Tax=Mycena sanguinolenta TaxID=230812 RepID=A0A8H7CGY1_9AGAR|nr:hypothetical protein MSAN_02308500 [Mycena sanguinolenta]